MKLHIFSIYDVKADAYIAPFFLPTLAMAKRAFADCVNSASHQFGQNPHDYTLFHIGTFNDENAEMDTHAPHTLGNGLEYVRKAVDPDQAELKLVSAGGTN